MTEPTYTLTFSEPEARILERLIRDHLDPHRWGQLVESGSQEFRFCEQLLNKLMMRSKIDA